MSEHLSLPGRWQASLPTCLLGMALLVTTQTAQAQASSAQPLSPIAQRAFLLGLAETGERGVILLSDG